MKLRYGQVRLGQSGSCPLRILPQQPHKFRFVGLWEGKFTAQRVNPMGIIEAETTRVGNAANGLEMVPGAGLEPALPYGNSILSRKRIPFRHPGG